jgi:DNA-3-methyladenine glycosylase
MRRLSADLRGPADVTAKRLLGCYLTRTILDVKVVCMIVETEAYDQQDPASHSYRGITPRNAVMFGDPGYLYVYRSYGIHYCMNVVTGPEGHASASLIRAVEPLRGWEVIKSNRPRIDKETMLTNGPGKVCQALAIGPEWNGHDLEKEPLVLSMRKPIGEKDIVTTTRIGITKAPDTEWRFYLRGNRFVSR